MSLFQIGKVLPDGKVRHIKAYLENTIDEISQKLRVFYSSEKRVDALLSLGDIDVLGPSPFGRWGETGHGTLPLLHTGWERQQKHIFCPNRR